MEHVLELMYEAVSVWIFCVATALMFYCFSEANMQCKFVTMNIYEQPIIYGAAIDEKET